VRSFLLKFLFFILYFFGAYAYAVDLPDAGSLQQQLDREKIQRIPKSFIKEDEKKIKKNPNATELTVVIKSINFKGNSLISSKELNLIVESYLNQSLGFSEIQNIVTKVNDYYRDRGWVAKAFLPEQAINDGNLIIEIKEGKFGGIDFNGDSRRVNKNYISSRILNQVSPGDFVDIKKMDRGVLLADDLPGVKITSSFAPGDSNGEANLILNVTDDSIVDGIVTADNNGSKSTGVARATANFNINSPFKYGDQLTTVLQKTDGNDYVSETYSFPINDNGLRTSLSASHLNYKIISNSLSALDAHGYSNVFDAQIFYPWLRSKYQNVYMIANFDHKNLYNSASGSVTSDYSVDVVQLHLIGNKYDSVFAGGYSQADVVLSDGYVDLNGSPNKASVQTTTNAMNQFAKFRFGINREQFIQPSWSLYASLQGQIASTNLDGSEKFYLGGPQGVRAYPVNEGSGSEGALMSLEMRYYFQSNLTIKPFYDFGWARVNVDNNFSGAPSLNEYSMKGVGLAIQYRSSLGPILDVTYSRRIGNNPNQTAAGMDQDGTKISDRLWIDANIPFSFF